MLAPLVLLTVFTQAIPEEEAAADSRGFIEYLFARGSLDLRLGLDENPVALQAGFMQDYKLRSGPTGRTP